MATTICARGGALLFQKNNPRCHPLMPCGLCRRDGWAVCFTHGWENLRLRFDGFLGDWPNDHELAMLLPEFLPHPFLCCKVCCSRHVQSVMFPQRLVAIHEDRIRADAFV